MASSFALANVSKTSATASSSSLSRTRCIPSVRRSSVRVLCTVQGTQNETAPSLKPLGFAAGLAVATVLTAAPVDAGVILQQPQLKKLDLSGGKEKSSRDKKASAAPSAPSLSGGAALGFLSLPLTVAACGGLYVAASKLDDGFDSFMDTAWVKDSDVNGVGYEEIYKATDYSVAGGRSRKQ